MVCATMRPAVGLQRGGQHLSMIAAVVPRRVLARSSALACGVITAIVLGACGSASTGGASTKSPSPDTAPVLSVKVPTTRTLSGHLAPAPPLGTASQAAAERPESAQFPPADGRSLSKLTQLVSGIATLAAANAVFTPGAQRFAFALTNKAQQFIYAPTAVYLATGPYAPATGPYVAPDDPMGVAPQYRSKENAAPGGLKAIYWTTVPLRSGVFDVLALTREGPKLVGSTGVIAVAQSFNIPAVGQRPPAIATDTLASVHGDVGLLTTRLPPENMHSVSFNQVLGKRPIALLVSTPELCTSRVCGPVTDIVVQLQHQFGNRITFIHQEVYVDNQPTKGLRPQLKAFHLQTEPWLFTIDRRGVIVGRLQGAFGVNEARQALEAALHN